MPKKKISLLAAMREAKAKFKLTGGRYARWGISEEGQILGQRDCFLWGYKDHREELCKRRARHALKLLGYKVKPEDIPRRGRLRERIVEVMARW